MNSLTIAKKTLKKDEGFNMRGYKCTEGVISFGYGFTFITKEEAEIILTNRIITAAQNLEKLKWFNDLDCNRKAALINLVYQLGFDGFKQFRKTIEYLTDGDYKKAATEMLDSKWAKQTRSRAGRIAYIIEWGDLVGY